MSSSKMILCLLLGVIFYLVCSTAMSDTLPIQYKPAVIYTSPNSAVITWKKIETEKEKNDYIIEYGENWKNSKMLHVSRNSNKAMIPNLNPDTLYNIRVRVPNDRNGGTQPGPSVSFRTKSAVAASIGVPENIAVLPQHSYRLLVTWDLPFRSRASDVVHYSLVFAPVYSPYLRRTSLLLPGNYKSFTLTYLRPDTMYKVKIAALLKTRKGPYSSWIIAQTVNKARIYTTQVPVKLIAKQPYPTYPTGTTTGQVQPTLRKVTQATRHVKPQPTEQATEQQATEQHTTQQITKQLTKQQPTTQQPTKQQTTRQPAQQRTRRITQQATQQTTQATQRVTQKATDLSTQQLRNNTTDNKRQQPTNQPTTLQATQRVIQQDTEAVTRQINTQTTKHTTTQPITRPSTTLLPVSGTTRGIQPATSSILSVITDNRQRDSQYISSSTTTRQPSKTPSSYPTVTISPKLVITGPFPTTPSKDTCEPLEPSMCSDIGYDTTKMASKGSQSLMMDHVESMWSNLTPLCGGHAKLKQFLCAASFPYCSRNFGGPFVPCRSMCMATMKSCKMNDNKEWPAELDCSNFPAVGENAICISYGYERSAATATTIQNTLPISPIANTDKTTQWSPEPRTVITIPATTSSESTVLGTRRPVILKPKTPQRNGKTSCEPLYLKACEGAGYQSVQFPNYFNHKHQNDAGVKISKYWPLIEVKCSPLLKLFLCSLYTPICTSGMTLKDSKAVVSRNILPCRSVCQQVSSDCSKLMKEYGFAWPDGINCDDFPNVDDYTCLSQKYLERIYDQGKENNLPTAPSTLKKAQATIDRSSTKKILLTLPGAISVEQMSTTTSYLLKHQVITSTAPSDTRETTDRVTLHTTSSSDVSATEEISTLEPSSPFPTEPILKQTKESILPTVIMTQGNYKIADVIQKHEEDSTEAITQWNQEELSSPSLPSTISTTRSNLDSTTFLSSSPATISTPQGCEPLYLKICNGVGYEFTQFPNFFNHTHQNDAGREVYRFWTLVEINCSPKLQLFLCSLYVPMCTKTPSRTGKAVEMTGGVPNNILPCRSLCQQVKRECGVLMKLYGVKWPEGVDCTYFPKKGAETCLYGNTNVTDGKGILKIAEAKKELSPKITSNIHCQPLPSEHACKNHYEMAFLSNVSESFQSINRLIKNHISTIKDSASKKCLRNLEMFLCSLHSPRCESDDIVFGPCRSQCKTTLRRCGELLKKIKLDIFELKDCRRFHLTRCTGKKRRLKIKSKAIKSL